MCINFWTLNHPKYKFAFASNRDEFLRRATERAKFWETSRDVLSGVDTTYVTSTEPLGGTWLGVNTKGRFISLTNFREPALPEIKTSISRGFLVRDLLLSENPIHEDLIKLKQEENNYDGFNLVAFDFNGEKEAAYYCTNRGDKEVIPLNDNEIYGLSNATLSIEWPKVQKGKPTFEQILNKSVTEQHLVEALFQMLRDTSPYQDGSEIKQLQDLAQCICIPKVHFPKNESNPYATRTSTIILINHDNELVFIEREWYNEHQEPYEDPSQHDREFRFNIQPRC
ncbi:hypothetical protein K7432_005068 [Basidiobolus ranarum]|uniref:Uncharacterized protein n=1 Tax=Basidiobolus ranarum TaxID=34480 RepID=A0ABR2WXA5_9FUNG